jgi:hypothetical protein
MSSQAATTEPAGPGRPVHQALGDGLRAALIEDPVGLVILPLILHFPNMVLEALQARFAGDLEGEILRSPALGLAISIGWGFALAGRLLGQALVIRRTAARLRHGESRLLEAEFEGVFAHFPAFVVVFLLFWAAFLSGFVFFVLPGLVIFYLWGFAAQAAALEPGGIGIAFRRSRAVLHGQGRRWLTGAGLSVAALALVAIGAGVLWAGVDEAFQGNVPFGVYIAAFGAMELVTVVFAAVWTALYLDLERGRAAAVAGPAAVAAAALEPPRPESSSPLGLTPTAPL